jgi:CubicO group peptidase (beta-lactamase class C family)
MKQVCLQAVVVHPTCSSVYVLGIGREFPVSTLSKWPSADPFPASLPPANLTLEEPVAFISGNPLITIPNTTPIYSNVGYGVLGAINIAANIKANGDGEPKTHKELIQRDIFEPFGLNSSFFRAPTDNATLARVAVAAGPLALFAVRFLHPFFMFIYLTQTRRARSLVIFKTLLEDNMVASPTWPRWLNSFSRRRVPKDTNTCLISSGNG